MSNWDKIDIKNIYEIFLKDGLNICSLEANPQKFRAAFTKHAVSGRDKKLMQLMLYDTSNKQNYETEIRKILGIRKIWS